MRSRSIYFLAGIPTALVVIVLAGFGFFVFEGRDLNLPGVVGFGPKAPTALEPASLPEGFKPMVPPMQMGGYAFEDADGNTVRLADFEGRPILLNIWAKWCAPCLEEMPKLNQLQAGTVPGTLAVVTVAVDEQDPTKVRDFLANRRWDALKPYLDPRNVFAKALDIKSIPVSLLIDKNGFALVRVDAPVDWYSDEAVRLLKQTIL
jgi:thiol-disulfide isomerase/thioredoxin